jgi:hypothetical protein
LDNSELKEETKKTDDFIWKYVLVRWYDAWVWAGKLVDWTHWHIVLEDARMLRKWWTKSGIWLSSLSVNWLDETKSSEIVITDPLKKVLINDLRVSTIFVCEPEVEKQIRNYEIAKQITE